MYGNLFVLETSKGFIHFIQVVQTVGNHSPMSYRSYDLLELNRNLKQKNPIPKNCSMGSLLFWLWHLYHSRDVAQRTPWSPHRLNMEKKVKLQKQNYSWIFTFLYEVRARYKPLYEQSLFWNEERPHRKDCLSSPFPPFLHWPKFASAWVFCNSFLNLFLAFMQVGSHF